MAGLFFCLAPAEGAGLLFYHAAIQPHTSVLAWYKGVHQMILSCVLFFFWFFSALFKASK